MPLDTKSNVTLLDPVRAVESPSIRIEYKGHTIDLGKVSDRLLDCHILELTNALDEMASRAQRHGAWESYEYTRSQVLFHWRGLIAEQARRRAIELSTMPVPFGAA